MAEQADFSGWAIVEMMGHQKEIGFVTTEAYGGAVRFRVDTPELPAREYTLLRPEWVDGEGTLPAGSKVQRQASPAHTRFVAPGSLYAMNPCTEEAAREALEKTVYRPIVVIERAAKALEAPLLECQDDSDLCLDCGHSESSCVCS